MALAPARRHHERMRSVDSRPALRVAAVFAVALFGAVIGGILVGATVASLTLSEDTDGLSRIGAGMAAAAVGLLAAAVVYVVATVIGVRRMLSVDRPAATITALIVAPVLLVAMAGLAGSRAWSPFGAAGTVGLLVAIGAAVLAVAGALDVVRAVRVGAGAAGVAIVGVALSFMQSGPAPAAGIADVYRRAAIPVALVDGTTLDAPAPGWRVASVEHPADLGESPGPLASAPARASVFWHVRSHVVQLQMVPQPSAGPTDCPDAEPGWICERLGVTPSGATVWGRHVRVGSRPGYQDVWAIVEGGRWHLSVAGAVQAIDVAEAVQVLSRLQPVDVDRYLAVAGGFAATA